MSGRLVAVAAAAAVGLVALLVGLSVAPRLQPSDAFQAKPRAVKPVPNVGAPPGPGSVPAPDVATPRSAHVPCSTARAGWSPDRLRPAGVPAAPAGSGPGRAVTAPGCRGPPA